MMSAALSGIKILDLSRVLAGPWCTQLLADLGATVIKVEKPGDGDDTRSWGPPYMASAVDPDVRMASYFMAANRGKQSVAIDIAQPEGAALVRDLAVHCDVLVENFKVGGLAKYGLGFADLAAANPRLVYCSITGFGQTGPYAERPGYDFIIQGMGGLMSVTGVPAGEPMRTGVALTDIMTGMYAVNGILAALLHRERTGLGQQIDVALLDVQVSVMANQALYYLVTGQAPGRHGNAHASIVPYQAFATRNGDITIAGGNDSQFRKLCAVLGQPALGLHPDYGKNASRVANREALIPILQTLLSEWDQAELLAALEAGGVPAGPINTLAQVFADPHVQARGMALTQESAAMGKMPGVRCPLRFSGSDVGTDVPPPTLGHDTETILRHMLGLDTKALADLHSAGAIG